ncbi:class I SAM-dependent methyltransferase [Dermabacteraceae bacterium P13138]
MVDNDSQQLGLSGVAHTMLTTMAVRAKETASARALISDPLAVEIIQRLESEQPELLPEPNEATFRGVVARTLVIDEEIAAFLAAHPQGRVINLGAGLDTRPWRLGTSETAWINADLPPVINARRRLLPASQRVTDIAVDLCQPQWADQIPLSDAPTLILLEGLLMFLPEECVNQLWQTIAAHFPGATAVADLLSDLAVGKSQFAASVHKQGVQFTWGVATGKNVSELHPEFIWLHETNLADKFHLITPPHLLENLSGLRRMSNNVATFTISSSSALA